MLVHQLHLVLDPLLLLFVVLRPPQRLRDLLDLLLDLVLLILPLLLYYRPLTY